MREKHSGEKRKKKENNKEKKKTMSQADGKKGKKNNNLIPIFSPHRHTLTGPTSNVEYKRRGK